MKKIFFIIASILLAQGAIMAEGKFLQALLPAISMTQGISPKKWYRC
jgi:hypothetical protein